MTQDNNTTQSGQYEALRAALAAQRNLWKEYNFPAYIGLDVHKGKTFLLFFPRVYFSN